MKDMSEIYEDANLRYHAKIQKYPQPVHERLAEMLYNEALTEAIYACRIADGKAVV